MGLFKERLRDFASITPTKTPPISPGPAVTAIASIALKEIPAFFIAWFKIGSILLRCARAASSGTTPPYAWCSFIWLRVTKLNILLLIILFLTDIVLGFFVWNLLRKLEAVEENLDELEKEYTQADTLLDSMQERIQNAMDRMKSIDRIGSFEADDETGYVFREMYSIIEELDGYYGQKSEITEEQ